VSPRLTRERSPVRTSRAHRHPTRCRQVRAPIRNAAAASPRMQQRRGRRARVGGPADLVPIGRLGGHESRSRSRRNVAASSTPFSRAATSPRRWHSLGADVCWDLPRPGRRLVLLQCPLERPRAVTQLAPHDHRHERRDEPPRSFWPHLTVLHQAAPASHGLNLPDVERNGHPWASDVHDAAWAVVLDQLHVHPSDARDVAAPARPDAERPLRVSVHRMDQGVPRLLTARVGDVVEDRRRIARDRGAMRGLEHTPSYAVGWRTDHHAARCSRPAAGSVAAARSAAVQRLGRLRPPTPLRARRASSLERPGRPLRGRNFSSGVGHPLASCGVA
jgi:hypothetical protein